MTARAHQEKAAPFEVVDDRAGAAAPFVGQQLDGRTAVPHVDAGIEFDLLAQHAHHLQAGVVAVGQDTRGRRAAGLLAQQVAAHRTVVLFLVEQHAELDQPADDIGAVHHHLRHELRFALEVAGPQGVVEVQLGTVILADGGLDPTFGHHRVAVAEAQLGGEDDLGAGLFGRERRGAAAATAADDQHIGRHQLRAGDVDVVDQRVGLQVAREVRLAGGAAVDPDARRNTRIGAVIGVEALEQFVDRRRIGAHRRRRAGPVALEHVVKWDPGWHEVASGSGGRVRTGRVEIDLHFAAFNLLQAPHEVGGTQRQRRDGAPHEQAEVVGTDQFGAGQRTQVTHHAFVELTARRGQLALDGQVNATLHFQPLRAGAVAPAAVAAMSRFRKQFIDGTQHLPAVADVLHLVRMVERLREVVEEGDLHVRFDQGFACKRGRHVFLAAAADHDAA
jgi:hypothetical protein